MTKFVSGCPRVPANLRRLSFLPGAVFYLVNNTALLDFSRTTLCSRSFDGRHYAEPVPGSSDKSRESREIAAHFGVLIKLGADL